MTAPALYARSTCLVCLQPVRFVRVAAGGLLPLDPAPHPEGTIVPVYAPGLDRPLARILDQPPAGRDAWREHHCDDRTRPVR